MGLLPQKPQRVSPKGRLKTFQTAFELVRRRHTRQTAAFYQPPRFRYNPPPAQLLSRPMPPTEKTTPDTLPRRL
ncbi:TPA: hypothetical protein ACFNMI_002156, partial [Neisseria bacilliformis]